MSVVSTFIKLKTFELSNIVNFTYFHFKLLMQQKYSYLRTTRKLNFASKEGLIRVIIVAKYHNKIVSNKLTKTKTTIKFKVKLK